MPISPALADRFASALPILVPIKRALDRAEESVFFLRCQIRKAARRYFFQRASSRTALPLGILCVKKTVYAEMAIRNVNSLHFLNPNHHFYIYCDDACFTYLQRHWPKFDYPDSVSLRLEFTHKAPIWQTLRLTALKLISEQGGALVDADSRWFSEPPERKDAIIFLSPAYFFKDNFEEAALLAEVLPRTEWESIVHYSSGYLFIPQKYVTPRLFSKIQALQTTLIEAIKKKKLSQHLLRLVDEISLNVILQQLAKKGAVTALKAQDGPGDRQILLSYYYGCWNHENDG
jgi:hypothetical protein